jgi:hypothetical protein
MSYNSKLDADEQITTEEDIAARLFEVVPGMSEEDCAEAGRDILLMVLKKYRPDLLTEADSSGIKTFNVAGSVTLPIGFVLQVEAENAAAAEKEARRMLVTSSAYTIHDFDGNKVDFDDDDIDVSCVERPE